MPELLPDETVTYACGECGKPIKTGCYCIECMAEAVPPYEGHDPDLDENGVCRVCGQYEPE